MSVPSWVEDRGKDVQEMVISSPGEMARYALMATETPAWEKRMKELCASVEEEGIKEWR
jgi:hypothetical protein